MKRENSSCKNDRNEQAIWVPDVPGWGLTETSTVKKRVSDLPIAAGYGKIRGFNRREPACVD